MVYLQKLNHRLLKKMKKIIAYIAILGFMILPLSAKTLKGYESYKPEKVYINVINATYPTKPYIEKELKKMLTKQGVQVYLDTEEFPAVRDYPQEARLEFAKESGADSAFIVWILNLNTRRGGMESGGGPGGTEGTGSTDDLAIIKFRVKLFSVENDDPIWAETVSTRGRGGLHTSGLRNHAYMIAKASFKSLKKSGHLKK